MFLASFQSEIDRNERSVAKTAETVLTVEKEKSKNNACGNGHKTVPVNSNYIFFENLILVQIEC